MLYFASQALGPGSLKSIKINCQEADVILLCLPYGARRPSRQLLEQGFGESLSAQAFLGFQKSFETFSPILLIGRVCSFHNSVGVKDDSISALEGDLERTVIRIRKKAEHQAVVQ